jgi:hypothetical protein
MTFLKLPLTVIFSNWDPMKFHLYFWPLVLTLLFVSCSDQEQPDEILTSTQAPSLESNKIVTDWSDLYLQVERDLKGFRPAPTCRALAYIHMGAFETVVPGMEHYRSLSSVIDGYHPPVLNYELSKINWPIALNAYYARVHLFFLLNANEAQVALIQQLESSELADLSQNVPAGFVELSIAWGRAVADEIIAYSETDREGAVQGEQALVPLGQPAPPHDPLGGQQVVDQRGDRRKVPGLAPVVEPTVNGRGRCGRGEPPPGTTDLRRIPSSVSS